MAQDITYQYDFSAEELDELKDTVCEKAEEMEEKEIEKRTFDSEVGAEIKKLKEAMYGALHKKKKGFEERHTVAHRIVNHEEGRVEFYDIKDLDHENLLHSEPLTDKDMQLSTDDQPTEDVQEQVDGLGKKLADNHSQLSEEQTEFSSSNYHCKDCSRNFARDEIIFDGYNWTCPNCGHVQIAESTDEIPDAVRGTESEGE